MPKAGYKILHAQHVEELTSKVNSDMARGWQPVGGVATCNEPVLDRVTGTCATQTILIQAMTKGGAK